MYFLKKLGHQELGSITEQKIKPSRGRYIYISKDDRILSFFPPLSQAVKNDSSLLPAIPLYSDTNEKVYCNYIYHNDKYHGSTSKQPRDEFRIYLNNKLEENELLFKTNDIIVLKKELLQEDHQTVYFLDRVTPENTAYYHECTKILQSSKIHKNYALHSGQIAEFEAKVWKLSPSDLIPVVDSTVTKKIQKSDTQTSDLFNSSSFRDFTMVAYNNQCAVTRSIIKYGNFMNLESAHIKPKSHGGTFHPHNGLALSRDIHWAFDKGFFTLSDDYTILIHPKIQSTYLKQYEGKKIFIPNEPFFQPTKESVRYHRENVFGLFLNSGRL